LSTANLAVNGGELARRCNAWLTSAVCHLVVMIALGISATIGANAPRPMELTVRLDQGGFEQAVTSVADDSVELQLPNKSSLAAGPLRVFEFPARPEIGLDSPTLLVDAALSASGLNGLNLAEIGDRSGEPAKGSSQFFGVNGYGNSIVYVVDCSGSMADNGKLERAKYELLHSIDQLSIDQKYFVIFYSDGAYPMEAKALVSATVQNVQYTRRWVQRAVPQGGTFPQAALVAALAMRPDTVYFLSDGLFDAGTIAEVRRLNRRRHGGIPIHAIAFVNRENLGLMRAIARDSGGEFRYVQ
jgi:hypothetical protein